MSLNTWFIATRPWSLSMTFVATCLAGIMAYSFGSFDPFLFTLTMIGLIIAHTASNMTNDWYDVKNGVDENAPTAEYRPHPLLFGQVDKGTYKMVIFAQFAVGFAIAGYLTWLQGLPVMVFSVLGVLFGVFYTAGPIKLKYRTLGEVSVFLAFGPLMVGGAFYAITGKFSWDPLLASTPIGLLIALVLLANNLRDRKFDANVGISTMATGATEDQGMRYFTALTASAYISVIALILLGIFSPFALLSFLSIKTAMEIIRQFSEKIPLTSDQQTAQLALQFGVLLTAGELVNVLYYTFF
ncbi:prenyltransferase [Candidatus Bathyarchaeota archaeon]|jgi:1,4-dihydroxy-2-naphthoate polyprenyltransferase|nr:prenyltransferase [Candidatus Bathyarchaeota archaeon]MBT4319015.1 prenyltransferase [Candidatus Bathyarchaeota archaeon]MBT4423305.1 prenyltransferase [Candidatus Bathyarchaeota archaeon]MBT7185824.1 prenyltransferase [Candidatus Bathyarchaeota archaeon]MBT7346491.1 prenyltransferase [Candidatus Bathyarchaeota archaeon]